MNNNIIRWMLAFLSAALAPAILVSAWLIVLQLIDDFDSQYVWVRTSGFLAISLTISAGYVLILGAPAFFILFKLRAVRAWSTIGMGFILGGLPVAVVLWPLKHSNFSSSAAINGVQTLVDGVPTFAGWLEFLYDVSFFGICGMVGAAAFWLVANPMYQTPKYRI